VATKYFHRTGLKYYVQLVGADPDWVDREGMESVRYINLKPDTYTLKIKAKDGQGNWSQNVALATIIVRPTFFQTTWFLILCILSSAHPLWIVCLQDQPDQKLQTVRTASRMTCMTM